MYLPDVAFPTARGGETESGGSKARFVFSPSELKEIRDFKVLHPDVPTATDLAGRHKFRNLNKWKDVSFKACDHGLTYEGKEIRPATLYDDAVILESIWPQVSPEATFWSVATLLGKSTKYTVNGVHLMDRNFDSNGDGNIDQLIYDFIRRNNPESFRKAAPPPNDDVLRILAQNQAGLIQGQRELTKSQDKLADGQTQLAHGQTKLAEGMAELANGMAGLGDRVTSLESCRENHQGRITMLESSANKFAQRLAVLESGQKQPAKTPKRVKFSVTTPKKVHSIPMDQPLPPPPGGFPLTVKGKTPCKKCAQAWQLRGTLCAKHGGG